MTNKDIGFDAWVEVADSAMLARYGIGLDDAGPDEEDLRRFFEAYPSAADFVEWWALKYDLDPLDEYFPRLPLAKQIPRR